MFNRPALLALVTLSLSFVSKADIVPPIGRYVNVTNNCPITVPLYIGGQFKQDLTTISADPSTSYSEFIGTDLGGFFYGTANGGNRDGNGAVRAGLTQGDDYYYLVKDPSWVNIGVSITPVGRAPESNGFCTPAKCELPNDCSDGAAFTSPPTRFPAPGTAPPNLPLHRCPGLGDAGFTITFCPSGTIPNLQTGPNTISLAGSNGNKCLTVAGGVFANGTPVQINDCNGSPSQKWVIKRGRGQVKVSGTNFCLDATSATPPDGTGLKIWQCYDDLVAQQWFFDGSTKQIWLNNNAGGGCVDLTDGDTANGRQVQVWSCGWDNPNQAWNV
ncbi:ricin B lectin domain-containing protein [Pterulicium gracile]|uniref:Ricin B lectin domain-containing protein n=1 Tax=Pterulicium gracile TaxID=1884261 RepID=A0A5C3QBB5_9AGAR|nr:ricin B lectin domain-containing protein [Pterula gracilis]